uniref:Uncharacterized protein n=1 Tax=Arundo donax TaxID=35708 RepID=A0A0A9ELA9_ARUDO
MVCYRLLRGTLLIHPWLCQTCIAALPIVLYAYAFHVPTFHISKGDCVSCR